MLGYKSRCCSFCVQVFLFMLELSEHRILYTHSFLYAKMQRSQIKVSNAYRIIISEKSEVLY